MKHLVLVSDPELQNIISGKQEYLLRFFKKRPDFLGEIASGDLVYFRKKEVLGQFEIGGLMIAEKWEMSESSRFALGSELWDLRYEKWGMTKEIFKEKIEENRILVIMQVNKLEQFITSPIETPRGRKEWVVLED